MKTTITQRIKELIDFKGMSINSFSKKINIVQTTLNRQISGESAMTLDTFISIMNCFPKVSLAWVLRGDGTMTKEEGKANGRCDERKFVVCIVSKKTKSGKGGIEIVSGGMESMKGTENRVKFSVAVSFPPMKPNYLGKGAGKI